jgi:drug/metabolite transporter (DMT)-like permease
LKDAVALFNVISRSSAFYVFSTGALLGSTLVFSRFALGQFEAQTFVSLRLGFASIAFLVAYFVLRVRPWPRDARLWGKAAIFGIIGTALTMSAFTNSLKYQSSGVTALLVTLSPIETALLAHLFLKDETLTRQRFLGALVAFSGVGLLLLRGESGLAELARADWRGYAWVMLGVLTNSMGLVYARRYLRDADPFVVTSIRIFTGAVVIIVLTAFTGGFYFDNAQPSGFAAAGYAAIAGTFFAFLLYLTCVQRFGATVASQSEYVVPMVATTLGVLMLGERVTLAMLAGMVIIFAGLWLFDQAGKKQRASQQQNKPAPQKTNA